MKNKKGNALGIFGIAIIIIALMFFLNAFKTASILGEGGNIGERRSVQIVSEDSEKITYLFTAIADVPSTGCGEKTSAIIDTDLERATIGGDYLNRNIGELMKRDYYSKSAETTEVTITGVGAIKSPCSGSPTQGNVYLENKKANCVIGDNGPASDIIKCRITADAKTTTPPVWFYGNDITMTARVTFYKAGYQPVVQSQQTQTQTEIPQTQSQPILESTSQDSLTSSEAPSKPFNIIEWLSNLWNEIIGWFME